MHLFSKPTDMQKQTALYIPKPCHEDWNNMSPTERGKFCSACGKQVIDFSLMSDTQILNYLSAQPGKVCGRFDAAQLERPLIETKIKNKKSWWMALAMPLLFLFERSEAQEIKVIGDTTIVTPDEKDILPPQHEQGSGEILVGKVAVCNTKKPASLIDTVIAVSNKVTVAGKVIDENNNPLPFASVRIKESIKGTTTDSSGNFSIEINSYNESVILTASYVGYTTAEKLIILNNETLTVTMQLEPVSLGEVVVTGYTIQKQFTGRVGGVSICRKITRAERIDSALRKSLKISGFKIYPNPVLQNGLIHLEIKQAGEYQLQLLDNQSRLITTKNINAIGNKSVSDFSIPSNIAAGIYYLCLINEQTRKRYTEKLIVQ